MINANRRYWTLAIRYDGRLVPEFGGLVRGEVIVGYATGDETESTFQLRSETSSAVPSAAPAGEGAAQFPHLRPRGLQHLSSLHRQPLPVGLGVAKMIDHSGRRQQRR